MTKVIKILYFARAGAERAILVPLWNVRSGKRRKEGRGRRALPYGSAPHAGEGSGDALPGGLRPQRLRDRSRLRLFPRAKRLIDPVLCRLVRRSDCYPDNKRSGKKHKLFVRNQGRKLRRNFYLCNAVAACPAPTEETTHKYII